MTTANDRFIADFNELHRVFQDLLGREDSFSNCIHQLKKRNVWVAEYFDELDNIRRLRNFIVHEQTDVRYAVAEATDEALLLMDFLIKKLKYPETAEVFQKDVKTFKTTDSLGKVLYMIQMDHRSQYPIFDESERFVGLLSDYGIVDILSDQLEDYRKPNLQIKGIQVSDILPYDKKRYRYRIIDRDLPLYEVKELVSESYDGGQSPVLLVSKHGRINQRSDLIGIITPLDLPEINRYLRR